MEYLIAFTDQAEKWDSAVRIRLYVEVGMPFRSTALTDSSELNYRTLSKKGITVRKTIDSLIVTYCIENNHELLHNDRDFDPYENYLALHVIHPGKE